MSRNGAWNAMAAECIDLDKGKVTFAEASAAGAAFLESQRAFKQAQEAEQAAEAALRDAQQTRRAAHDALLEAKRRALRKYGAASGVVVEQSEWASMFSSASDAVQKTQAGDEAELAMSPAPSEGDAEDDVTEASSSQVASDAVSGAEEHEAVEEDSVGAGEDDRDEQPVQGQPRRSGSVRSSSSSSSAASESRQKRESEETAVPSKHPRAATPFAFNGNDAGESSQEVSTASAQASSEHVASGNSSSPFPVPRRLRSIDVWYNGAAPPISSPKLPA